MKTTYLIIHSINFTLCDKKTLKMLVSLRLMDYQSGYFQLKFLLGHQILGDHGIPMNPHLHFKWPLNL